MYWHTNKPFSIEMLVLTPHPFFSVKNCRNGTPLFCWIGIFAQSVEQEQRFGSHSTYKPLQMQDSPHLDPGRQQQKPIFACLSFCFVALLSWFSSINLIRLICSHFNSASSFSFTGNGTSIFSAWWIYLAGISGGLDICSVACSASSPFSAVAVDSAASNKCSSSCDYKWIDIQYFGIFF